MVKLKNPGLIRKGLQNVLFTVVVLFSALKVQSQTAFSSENIISNAANNILSINVEDLDQDGDLDIIGSGLNAEIFWFENNGNQLFTERVIATNIFVPRSIKTIDLDGDLDYDILVSSITTGQILWFENNGFQQFTQNIISINANGAQSVFAIDLDGDGDTDVLSASSLDNKISWYENNGFEDFTEIIVSNTASSARSVFAADIDGDTDIDIVAGYQNSIVLFVNDGFQGFTEQLISGNASIIRKVFAADVDGDGDLDLLSASSNDDKIAWYQNRGSLSFSQQLLITNTADQAQSLDVADFDGDFDFDIVTASSIDNRVVWHDNDGSQSFTEREISNNAFSAENVIAADLDNDSDQDVIYSSSLSGTIGWFENLLGESAVQFISSTSAFPGKFISLNGINLPDTALYEAFLGNTQIDAFTFGLQDFIHVFIPEFTPGEYPLEISKDGTSIYSTNFTVLEGYPSSGALFTNDSRIDEVTFGSFVKNTADGNCVSYSDFTSDTVNTSPGAILNSSVVLGTCNGFFAKSFAIYADFNQNQRFESTEQLASGGPVDSVGILSFDIVIPANIADGNYRLRVISEETDNPLNIDGFGDYIFGETEDYTLTVSGSVSTIPQFVSLSSNNPLPGEWVFLYTNNVDSESAVQTNVIINGITSINIETRPDTVLFEVPDVPDGLQPIQILVNGDTIYNNQIQITGGYPFSRAFFDADTRIDALTLDATTNLSDSTLCASYTDFSADTSLFNFDAGQTISGSIALGTCGGNFSKNYAIYVDFNQDFRFSADELMASGTAPTTETQSLNFSFVIPNLSSGNYRLRAILNEDEIDNGFGTYLYGETEDYTVVIANANSNPLSLFEVNPTSGTPGDIIEIFGQNFDVSPALNQVFFDSTPASVVSGTQTSLTVEVPDPGYTGIVDVVVSTNNGADTLRNVFEILATGINPTAFYPFSGTQELDTSGNNFNGSFFNAPFDSHDRFGDFGASMEYDGGSNTYFEVVHNGGIDLRNDLTINAWIRPDYLPGQVTTEYWNTIFGGEFFGQINISDSGELIYHWTPDGVNYPTIASVEGIIEPNKWQMVTITFSNNYLKFYKNGQDVQINDDGSPVDSILVTNRNTSLGNWFQLSTPLTNASDNRWFDGDIDDLAIFAGTALSQNEISSRYQSENHLGDFDIVAAYNFDNGSLNDSHNNYNGVGTNEAGSPASLSFTTDRNDQVNSALITSNDGTHSRIIHSKSINTKNGITVNMWINPTELPETGRFGDAVFSESSGSRLMIGTDGTLFYHWQDLSGTFLTESSDPGVISTGVWQMVTFSIDDQDSLKLYHNGIIIHEALITQTIELAGEFSIASNDNNEGQDGDRYYNGAIDDATIYQQALPANIIISLFDQPMPPFITSFSPVSGTVGSQLTLSGSVFTETTNVSFVNTSFQSFNASYNVNSDTEILLNVPNVSPGLYTIEVTNTEGSAVSDNLFEVTEASSSVTISSFNPTSAVEGDQITINGTGFGSISADATITFGSANATVVSINSTEIVVEAPSQVASDYNITVSVGGSSAVSTNVFELLPSISRLNSNSGFPNDEITITGTGFSSVAGNMTLSFGSTTATINPFSQTELSFVIPDLTPGNYTVELTVNGNTSTSTESFTINEASTDTAPPVLSNLNYPTSVSITNPINIQFNLTDDSELAFVQVYYSVGSENIIEVNSFSDADFNGSEYDFTIPGSAIDELGTFFIILSEDVVGNRFQSETFFIARNVTNSTIINTNKTGTTVGAYNLFAVPVENVSVSSSIQRALGSYDRSEWRLFTWNPGASSFTEFPGFSNLEAGRGYFLIRKDAATITYSGQTVGGNYTITGNAGFNLIGNPYPFQISASQIEGNSGDFLKFNGSYFRGSTLNPFEAGFIDLNSTSNLIFRTGSNARIKREDSWLWKTDMKIETEHGWQHVARLGMNQDSDDSKDAHDLSPLPSLSDEELIPALLFSRNGLDLATDIVGDKMEEVWNITLKDVLEGEQVQLSWQNDNLNGALFLEDKSNGTVIDMVQSSKYRFTYSGQALKIHYGIPMQATNPEIKAGSPVPNPTNGNAHISVYNLRGDEEVTVEIASINGRVMETYTTDAEGQLDVFELKMGDMPAGMYIYKLTINNGTETQTLNGHINKLK